MLPCNLQSKRLTACDAPTVFNISNILHAHFINASVQSIAWNFCRRMSVKRNASNQCSSKRSLEIFEHICRWTTRFAHHHDVWTRAKNNIDAPKMGRTTNVDNRIEILVFDAVNNVHCVRCALSLSSISISFNFFFFLIIPADTFSSYFFFFISSFTIFVMFNVLVNEVAHTSWAHTMWHRTRSDIQISCTGTLSCVGPYARAQHASQFSFTRSDHILRFGMRMLLTAFALCVAGA